MNTEIKERMLLLKSSGQLSLIDCPNSYDKLLRYILHRFELNDTDIKNLCYLDDEGDIIRVESQEDLDSMIINNSQTKIICVNVELKLKIGYIEKQSNASIHISS